MTEHIVQYDDLSLPDAAGTETRYRVEVWENVGRNWDALVGSFADACLEQMSAYAVPRWGHSRLCGLALRDFGSNEPLALALLVLATIPIVKLGLAYVKFGPLWRRVNSPANPDVLSAALEAVKQKFAVERGLVVRVMPPPDPDYSAEWERSLLVAGFGFAGAIKDPDRFLVDLRLTEAEQKASVRANWRANLNKSLAGGLDIQEVDPQAALPDFLVLYRGMVARKHFADHHHVDLLPAFVAAAAETPELGVRLFLAYHEGRPVAGSMIVGAGERVFVSFSASDERASALRVGYALRWWIINRLSGSNARWLDLGGAEGDAGLRSFKAGNVGMRGRIVQIPGEFDFATNALGSIVLSAMTSTRNLFQGRTRKLQRA